MKENKYEQSLTIQLEVCYLDLNGPRNMGERQDPEILRQFPPFDPDLDGLLAPLVIKRVNQLIQLLDFSTEDTKELFENIALKLHENLRLPMSPEEAWQQIDAELTS